MLKEKVKQYLEVSGISKTLFCRRIGISTNHLYGWMKSERNISDELSDRIREYLEKYSVPERNF